MPQKTRSTVFGKRKHFKAESTRWRFVYAPFWDIDLNLKGIEMRAKGLDSSANMLIKFWKVS